MWPLKAHPHHQAKILGFAVSGGDRDIIADVAQSSSVPAALSSTLNQNLAAGAAVVILDRDLVEIDWRAAVRTLVTSKLQPCVILVSSVVDDYLFEELVKHGGFDVVVKPIRADELKRVLKLALSFWRNRRATG